MFKKMGSVFSGSQGGKGFYIVLGLCAAVVGTSSWILLSGGGTDVDDGNLETAGVAIREEAVVTMLPQSEAAETMAEASPAASAAAQESAAAEEYLWPVDGVIERADSGQTLQYDATMADWRCHEGLDIACTHGTPVLAAADGTVVRVWEDPLLGVSVEIQHEDGVNSVYANLAPDPAVSAGQLVSQGQTVGHVGGSALGEAAEVSHLHFEMTRNGLNADPEDYLW